MPATTTRARPAFANPPPSRLRLQSNVNGSSEVVTSCWPPGVRIVATSIDHGPEFEAAKTAIGFNATLAKPFRKETLGGLVAARPTAQA